MWNERMSWVKPYANDTFMTRISTIQCSKNMINYFRSWIKQHISLIAFVRRYEEVINKNYQVESKLDYKMHNGCEPINNLPLELHL